MSGKMFVGALALLIAGTAIGFGAARAPVVAGFFGATAQGSHKDEGEKGGHAHGGKEEHSEGTEELRLTPEQIQLANIEIAAVAASELPVELSLNAEVALNRERVVEIVPQIAGVAREVHARLGEEVRANALLAVIESRELADTWAELLGARERVTLAQSRYAREEGLRQKRITSEQEFSEAREALAEAQIKQRAAEQKLRAIGAPGVDGAPPKPEALTRYPILAPIAGTIIERRVTEGEHVEGKEPIFRLAQLEQLWVIANVYPKDVGRVKVGQDARILVQGYSDRVFTGKITWIAALLDEKTRTLQVRIEVDNRERLLRPGVFARVHVAVDKKTGIILPAAAVTGMKGRQTVFIDEGEGRFAPREVVIGARVGDKVEIAWGVDEGERVVTSGAFLLKSEIEKAGFEAGHGH